MSDLVAYFGYGSLVNRDTHRTPTRGIIATRLKGWARGWHIRGQAEWATLAGETGSGAVCALTAEPKIDVSIDGALILDSAANLPDVDAREHRYDRHQLSPDQLESDQAIPDVPLYVYSASDAFRGYGDQNCPIYRSYVDAVLQGYLKLFGPSGLDRFVDETFGWHVPILDDRAQPRYPRAVNVSAEETRLFDGAIARAGKG